MPLIERTQTAGTKSAVPDLAYEEVRQSFFARLQSEQTRLEALNAALDKAAGDSLTAFGDLERFAHRLRGAAAVFDVPELREAAKALELTAAAAALRCSPRGEPLVLKAAQALEALLSRLNGDTPSPAQAMGPAPIN